MIKLFHFHNPNNFTFAQASRLGTWQPEGMKICPECSASRQKRVSPLILEWESGSNEIGDFIWPGFDDELVCSQRVRDAFEASYRGIEYYPVEFWQNPRLKKPTNVTRRSKPRVWLPYSGPVIWDIHLKSWCHLDLNKSDVKIIKSCSTCGTIFHSIPTKPFRHLVVDQTTWGGEEMFHIYENPGLFFCTERVKEYVEQAGFTNVKFLEDGIIPD